MKVLMVCLGNICRSPLAQGILEQKLSNLGLDWYVDSAGTGNWHAGEQPDKRSVAIAQKNGLDISKQKARQITKADLKLFDLILAMDSSNYNDVLKLCNTDEEKSKVKILLNYVHEGENRSVPDPYFTGGFDEVYRLLDEAMDWVIKQHAKEMVADY